MSDNMEIIEVDSEEENPLEGDIRYDEDMQGEYVDLYTKYLKAERAARSEQFESMRKWDRQLEAIPEFKNKNHPMPNASNVEVPLAQIIVQNLYSHLKSAFDEVNPFWTARSHRHGLTDEESQIENKKADILTHYFGILSESKQDLDLEPIKRQVLLEACHKDIVFVGVDWHTKMWKFRWTDDEGNENESTSTAHDGPRIRLFDPYRVVYPFGYKKVDDMPWFAYVEKFAYHELLDMRSSWPNVDDLIDYRDDNPRRAPRDEWNRRDPTEEEQNAGDLIEVDPKVDTYDITHLWFYSDVDGDGTAEDIEMWFHEESGIVLGVEYNEMGRRPVVPMRYIPRTQTIEGRGVGHITEHSQDEVSTVHNMRNDNMKVANMRMFAVRRNAGWKPKEKIYPGKVFFMDNPKDDVVPLQIGEVYNSSAQAEQLSVQYAQRATAMSDIMGGFADQMLKSRDTASSQKIRMSTGSSILDSITDGLKESFSEIGRLVLYQLIWNRDRVIENERQNQRLTEDQILMLDEILSMDLSEVPNRISFSVKMSNASQTYEAKRQNMMMMSQLFTTYSQQITPFIQQVFGPQGKQMMQQAPEMYKHLLKIYTGSTKLMQNIFHFFGEDDPAQYVPETKRAEDLMELIKAMQEGMGEMGALPSQVETPLQGAQNGARPTGAAGAEEGAGGGSPDQGGMGEPG